VSELFGYGIVVGRSGCLGQRQRQVGDVGGEAVAKEFQEHKTLSTL
jgi:hypothetical protein